MVAGGWSEATSRALNDVYLSIDEGFSWSLATGQAAWSARHGHQLVGAGGAWYIIAGQTAALTNIATQEGRFTVNTWLVLVLKRGRSAWLIFPFNPLFLFFSLDER